MVRVLPFQAVAVALVGVGCGLGGVDGPGSPDASVHVDADPDDPDADITPDTGLMFSFRSEEPLPTASQGQFELMITDARLELNDVRAIGDAAPGDERTTEPALILDFSKDSISLSYPEAPPGVYSLLIAELVTYEIKGTVEFGGDEKVSFEIEDDPAMAITLNIDLGGQSLDSDVLAIEIEANLRNAVDAVNWQSLSNQEEIHLGPSYSKINDVRDALRDGFMRAGSAN